VPELIEVEAWRSALARTVGRTVVAVDAPDSWYLKGGVDVATVAAVLEGATVGAVDRYGKLLVVRTDSSSTLGLRFGMTGRLFVDRVDAVGPLEYGPSSARPEWRRFGLSFDDGTEVEVNDPRRLGGVSLDPDLSGFGPDATTLDEAVLAAVLRGRRAPVKALLMDQARVAGLGNLLCDELLWRAGVDPRCPGDEVRGLDTLAAVVRSTVADLTGRGGSHTGDLQVHRTPGGRCPRCGAALRRDRVGGRTTWWCPTEQDHHATGGSTTTEQVHH